jgi:hypothetical protein
MIRVMGANAGTAESIAVFNPRSEGITATDAVKWVLAIGERLLTLGLEQNSRTNLTLDFGDVAATIGAKCQDADMANAASTLAQQHGPVLGAQYYDMILSQFNAIYGHNWLLTVEQDLYEPEKERRHETAGMVVRRHKKTFKALLHSHLIMDGTLGPAEILAIKRRAGRALLFALPSSARQIGRTLVAADPGEAIDYNVDRVAAIAESLDKADRQWKRKADTEEDRANDVPFGAAPVAKVARHNDTKNITDAITSAMSNGMNSMSVQLANHFSNMAATSSAQPVYAAAQTQQGTCHICDKAGL